MQAARAKCAELWLVVANDHFSMAAPSEITEEAKVHRYMSSFDKVFWMEPDYPTVTQLA